jgi:hypothetical protein
MSAGFFCRGEPAGSHFHRGDQRKGWVGLGGYGRQTNGKHGQGAKYVAAIDAWIASSSDKKLTRAHAIRGLVALGLKAKGK